MGTKVIIKKAKWENELVEFRVVLDSNSEDYTIFRLNQENYDEGVAP